MNTKLSNHRLTAALGNIANKTMAVYVIGESELGPCKIGYADIAEKRRRQMQIGNPRELVVYFQAATDRPRLVERITHSLIAPHYRIRGEWFNVTPDDAELAVRRALTLADAAQEIEIAKQSARDS